MWVYRWQRLQLLSHLKKGCVRHGQDVNTGQTNCNCTYFVAILFSSFILEEKNLGVSTNDKTTLISVLILTSLKLL